MADGQWPLEFYIPAGQAADTLVASLAGKEQIRPGSSEQLRCTLLDTFDWRLHAAGLRLERWEGQGGSTLVWRDRVTTELHREMPATEARFAGDFPPGPLRSQMEDLLAMRVLLPRVEMLGEHKRYAVRDAHEKTVLGIDVYTNRPITPGEEIAPPLPPRLRLLPVRGYAEHLDRARRLLVGRLALQVAEQDVWDEALQALGRCAGDYSSKLRVPLQPAMTAGEATRRILLELLNTLETNEAGTIADLDSEFLHDFRVAVRRTRSALSQIKRVLSPPALERFREEFAWLGDITSPVRDLDVHLLEFPVHQAALPEPIRPQLEPLRAFLRRHQQSQQRSLAQHLRSRRYRTLKEDWRAFLETGETGGGEWPDDAARPVEEVARERIWKVYRRVLKEGAALGPESPAERFHDLRKTCKKLRYLLEFFHSLFPPAEMDTLIKSLKLIQDNLGTYQDLEVQADALTAFGPRMQEEGGAPAGCLMAMGRLVDDLGRRQTAVRAEFADRYAAFTKKRIHKRFRTLFSPRSGKGEPAT